MGWSFRKSVNLGPLRVNLSKSVSAPVGGFRAFVSVLLPMAASICGLFFRGRNPTVAHIDAVAEAGRYLRKLRDTSLSSMTGGLRALYRTLDLPGKNPLRAAHAALDAAVLKAYGFSAKGDLLEQILKLNKSVAAKIAAAEAVVAPGVPAVYGDSSKLVSEDCIGG